MSSPSPARTDAGNGHDARRELGARGEQLAAEHLQRLGYTILARNHRTRHGELDIVASCEGILVFVEVKTRRLARGASPWHAIHADKRRRVRLMARAYLADVADRPHGMDVRFDAIGVVIDATGRLCALDHIEGAF